MALCGNQERNSNLQTPKEMNPVKDVVGRSIEVGDFVYHYNSLYEVLTVSIHKGGKTAAIELMIYPKSKTSKKKRIMSYECCVIPKEDMLAYLIAK